MAVACRGDGDASACPFGSTSAQESRDSISVITSPALECRSRRRDRPRFDQTTAAEARRLRHHAARCGPPRHSGRMRPARIQRGRATTSRDRVPMKPRECRSPQARQARPARLDTPRSSSKTFACREESHARRPGCIYHSSPGRDVGLRRIAQRLRRSITIRARHAPAQEFRQAGFTTRSSI